MAKKSNKPTKQSILTEEEYAELDEASAFLLSQQELQSSLMDEGFEEFSSMLDSDELTELAHQLGPTASIQDLLDAQKSLSPVEDDFGLTDDDEELFNMYGGIQNTKVPHNSKYPYYPRAYSAPVTPVLSARIPDITSVDVNTTQGCVGGIKTEYLGNTPAIIIPAMVALKIKYIIERVQLEVGWLCSAVRDEYNDIHITDVYIPEQQVHGATCEIKPEGIGKLALELIREGKMEEVNNLRIWGHSHVNMGTSPSQQDITEFSKLSKTEGIDDYFVMMIHNKYNQIYCEVVDLEANIKFSNLPTSLTISPISEKEINQSMSKIESDLKTNVSRISYAPPINNNFQNPKKGVVRHPTGA